MFVLSALSEALTSSLGRMGVIDYSGDAYDALFKEGYSEYIEFWQRYPFGFSGSLYILEVYFDILGGGPRSIDAPHSWCRRTVVCGRNVLMYSLVEYVEMMLSFNPDTIFHFHRYFNVF